MKAVVALLILAGIVPANTDMAPTIGVTPRGVDTSLEQVASINVEAYAGNGFSVGCGYDGTYMYGSLSTAIDYYEIGTRIKVGSFTGPQNPNRALAWDGTHFYTGNFGTDVYRLTWNGVSGSTATSTVWSTAATSVYGAAWDEINDCMWVTSSDASGIVAEINEDGTLVQNHILVSGGIYGGACMGTSTGCIGTLWILVQTPSDILGGYEVYPTALGRDTWGAIKAVF